MLQRGPADPGGFDEADASRMTILEHLEALRRVLIISMAAWAVCTIVAFFFWGRILVFLQDRGHVGQLQYFTPTGGFTLGIPRYQ